MTLKESLITLANAWCAAHGRQLSSLGSLVVKDAKFFGRIAGGAGLTVATFESFLGFFRDPLNWPGMAIPEGVQATLETLPPHKPVEQLEMVMP